MERRTFLRSATVAGAVAVAGCSGGPTHRLQGDVWEGIEPDERETSVTLSGEVTLEGGEYTTRDVAPDADKRIEVAFEVTEGGPIDVMFLTRSEYDNRYRDGEADDVEFLQQLSEVGATSGDLAHTVSPGEYVLVFDNTGAFGTTPEGGVTVDLEIVFREPTGSLIATALEHIEAAGDEIDRQAQAESYDAEVVHGELDAAETALDRAAGVASDQQQGRIEELRTVIAWYRNIADALAAFDAAVSELETVDSLFESERFEESDESLGTVQDHLADAEDALENARTEHDSLDTTALENFDDATAAAAMDDFASYVETMQNFTDGYRSFVAASQSYVEGAEHYDDENWTLAIEPLEAAQSTYAEAEETFRNTEKTAPDGIVNSMVERTCLAAAIKDASGHFAEAARAAQDNDVSTFEEENAAGQEALDRC